MVAQPLEHFRVCAQGVLTLAQDDDLSLATLGWLHRQPVTCTCQVMLAGLGISLCRVYQGLSSVLSACSHAGVCPLPGRPHSAVTLEQDIVTQRDWGLSQAGDIFVPGEDNISVVCWLSCSTQTIGAYNQVKEGVPSLDTGL